MAYILIVDDDAGFVEAITEILEMLGHTVESAPSVEMARARLTAGLFDLLLLDMMLPDGSGFDVLDGLKPGTRPGHIAFVTGQAAVKSFARALAGPDVSFLLKPIDLDKIKALLNRVSSPTTAQDSDSHRHFGVLIGESMPMQQLYKMIERVGRTRANVMIQGESGTGKELVATAIHNASAYDGPFVAANCGAISQELIGSELFGHEKGAFTGAVARKAGLFERANGGTLFLDEITEMPIELQPNLLRVLETGKITRLGGTKEIEVSCRVVSATNRTSEQLVKDQCLREDIYFRLAVFPIQLIPLAQRKEDIPLLCTEFLAQLNAEYDASFTLTDDAVRELTQYRWPGNVRELRHAIHRAFIMTDPDSPHLQLPDKLGSPFSEGDSLTPALEPGRTIQDMEKELITVTLQQVDNNKPKAAEMLGISLKTLYNRINQYEEQSSDTTLPATDETRHD